jgi:hypothetical protein
MKKNPDWTLGFYSVSPDGDTQRRHGHGSGRAPGGHDPRERPSGYSPEDIDTIAKWNRQAAPPPLLLFAATAALQMGRNPVCGT